MEMCANEPGYLLYLMRATYLESRRTSNTSNGVSGRLVFNNFSCVLSVLCKTLWHQFVFVLSRVKRHV